MVLHKPETTDYTKFHALCDDDELMRQHIGMMVVHNQADVPVLTSQLIECCNQLVVLISAKRRAAAHSHRSIFVS